MAGINGNKGADVWANIHGKCQIIITHKHGIMVRTALS